MVHVMSEVKNPVLVYADSYRDAANRGQKLADVWSVITDLERNIAPMWDAQRLRADTADADLLRTSDALIAAEQRITEMKAALDNLLDAYSRPDDRICCSGADCGCMGATNHQQAEHYAKEAIARAASPEAEFDGRTAP